MFNIFDMPAKIDICDIDFGLHNLQYSLNFRNQTIIFLPLVLDHVSENEPAQGATLASTDLNYQQNHLNFQVLQR